MTSKKESPNSLELWVQAQKSGSSAITKEQEKVISNLRKELEGDDGFVVESDEDYEFLGKLLVHANGQFKDLKGKKEAVTKPINAALRAFQQWWKPPIDGWEQIIRIIKRKMGEYERKLIEEKERAAALLVEASASGDFELAHEVSQVLHEEMPEVSGIASQEVWVVDEAKVNFREVPVEYLALDQGAVNKYLKFWSKLKERPEDLPGLPFKLEVRVRSTGR